MVTEQIIPPFSEWIGPAVLYWFLVAGVLAAVSLVLSYIFASVRAGPVAGAQSVMALLVDGILDLMRMSPRRVYALARLAVQESIRRRVWVVLVVFAVLLAFGAWFLETAGNEPARLYLGYVFGWATFLVLSLALLISVFSLPADIAKKTIYTVVTKPVRPSEIVLGRILGFTAVGTGVLACMGVLGYAFVARQLNHTHEIRPEDIRVIEGSAGGAKVGRTSEAMSHRHEFDIDATGIGQTDMVRGHRHLVEERKEGDKTVYDVGPPEEMLVARVPIYGELRFKDRDGSDTDRGISVGDEWTYRQYIEGGTGATAIWRFQGLRQEMFPVDRFPQGVPIQMNFGIFRSYKGEVEEGIPGSIVLRNPKTKFEVQAAIFTPREFTLHTEYLGRKIADPKSPDQERSVDLFDDLVGDGELEIQIRCLPPGQYYGVARPDLYLLAEEASFKVNFAKGLFGVWLQMVLIIGVGVMFSTFLNGAVAMLATLAIAVAGHFITFLSELSRGETLGGGPLESMIRILKHSNLQEELDPGLGTTLATNLDDFFQGVLFIVVSMLPDLPSLSDSDWVASGFDIPFNHVLVHSARALAYLGPLFLAGYVFLNSREVAK